MSEQFLQQILTELKNIKGEQQSFSTSIVSLKTLMENKFEEMNIKVEELSTKVEETNNKVEELNTKVEETNNRVEKLNTKVDRLSEKMDLQHIENINADNRLMNEINSLKDNVIFVNRKVADAELEINSLKNRM